MQLDWNKFLCKAKHDGRNLYLSFPLMAIGNGTAELLM
jgi:hypothetical protein